MIKKEMSCVVCNKTVPLEQLRADKLGKNWICSSCYEKQNYKKPLSVKDFRTIGLTKKEIEKPDLNPRKKQLKQKYRCALCKFVSNQTSATAICPNCGKKDVLIRVMSTNELLEELSISPFS